MGELIFTIAYGGVLILTGIFSSIHINKIYKK